MPTCTKPKSDIPMTVNFQNSQVTKKWPKYITDNEIPIKSINTEKTTPFLFVALNNDHQYIKVATMHLGLSQKPMGMNLCKHSNHATWLPWTREMQQEQNPYQ